MTRPGLRCTASRLLVSKVCKRTVVLCGSVQFRVVHICGLQVTVYTGTRYSI